jgi:hypothetical protein
MHRVTDHRTWAAVEDDRLLLGGRPPRRLDVSGTLSASPAWPAIIGAPSQYGSTSDLYFQSSYPAYCLSLTAATSTRGTMDCGGTRRNAGDRRPEPFTGPPRTGTPPRSPDEDNRRLENESSSEASWRLGPPHGNESSTDYTALNNRAEWIGIGVKVVGVVDAFVKAMPDGSGDAVDRIVEHLNTIGTRKAGLDAQRALGDVPSTDDSTEYIQADEQCADNNPQQGPLIS